MRVLNLEQTCYACPTIFEWDNKHNNHFHFRLRHGYATIINETDDVIVIEGDFPEADGVCSWEQVVKWAQGHNLKLKISL